MKRQFFLSLLACTLFSLTSVGHHPALAQLAADPTPSPTPDYTPRVSAKADAPDAHFKTVGEFATFRWTPPTYTTGFEYDLYYYIPKSVGLHPEVPVKSILFMHGGGENTMTRAGATWAVSLYAKDFIKMADEQNLIVVFPSSAGLNWGGHTRVFIRELAKLMRQQLPIDPDRIALMGHSMGGMGITRNAFFLGDQFAFIMPTAAGMDPVFMTEENLVTLFNVPYHHVQGIHDAFDVFVERAKLHEQKMKELEIKFKRKAPFELTLTNTGHNYDLKELSGLVNTQFAKSTRDLYQRDLFGSFLFANQIVTDNKIQYNYTSNSDYFWLRAQEFTPAEKATRSNFEAHVMGNQVWVDFKGAHNVKTLRVYLSKQMLTFFKPVSIIVNGIRKFHRFVIPSRKKALAAITERSDSGFEFDQYVDVDVTDSQQP